MNIIAESLKDLDKHICEKLDEIINGGETPNEETPVADDNNEEGDTPDFGPDPDPDLPPGPELS